MTVELSRVTIRRREEGRGETEKGKERTEERKKTRSIVGRLRSSLLRVADVDCFRAQRRVSRGVV